ncbi:P1 family peptidase [Streptomyces sp. NPDC052309]|uniref:P1 family peptidase n=1 Tax=Streptomyces sp. NPDC052309 TaxID=3155421 RepID=UPI0034348D64
MDRFYTAAVQAIEEAVLNALIANETMVGRNGHRSPAPPPRPRARTAQALLKNSGAYQHTPARGSTSGGCRVAEEGVRRCAGAARASGCEPGSPGSGRRFFSPMVKWQSKRCVGQLGKLVHHG